MDDSRGPETEWSADPTRRRGEGQADHQAHGAQTYLARPADR